MDDHFLQLVLNGEKMGECTTSSSVDMCNDFLSAECDRVCINIVENVSMKDEMENM